MSTPMTDAIFSMLGRPSVDDMAAFARTLEEQNTALRAALEEIRDLHDGEEDIDGDGDPNRAMRVNQIIDAVL